MLDRGCAAGALGLAAGADARGAGADDRGGGELLLGETFLGGAEERGGAVLRRVAGALDLDGVATRSLSVRLEFVVRFAVGWRLAGTVTRGGADVRAELSRRVVTVRFVTPVERFCRAFPLERLSFRLLPADERSRNVISFLDPEASVRRLLVRDPLSVVTRFDPRVRVALLFELRRSVVALLPVIVRVLRRLLTAVLPPSR